MTPSASPPRFCFSFSAACKAFRQAVNTAAAPATSPSSLGLVGLYIRLRLTDTPAFEALADSDDVATSPLREAVQTAWRPILQVIGMMIIFNVGYYVVFTYLPT